MDVMIKKRGRPPKGGASNAAVSENANEDALLTPKKRGRPSKAKGRGRPRALGSPASDAEPDTNGGGSFKSSKPAIVATGKGRGRPPKASLAKPESESGGNASDGDSSTDEKPVQSVSSAKRRKLGRPKKHQPSDEEEDSDNDEEESRPVGRPATGAINLNIVRTGRGAGRPKKDSGTKRATNGDVAAVPKKRGRPPTGSSKPAYIPSGKPRGRPKVNKPILVEDDDEDDESASNKDFKNYDSGDSNADGSAVMSPKKRGRPAKTAGTNSGKPRGRPKANSSLAVELDDDDEDASAGLTDEQTTGSNGEAAMTLPKKGGRFAGNKDTSGKSHGRKSSNWLGGDMDEQHDALDMDKKNTKSDEVDNDNPSDSVQSVEDVSASEAVDGPFA